MSLTSRAWKLLVRAYRCVLNLPRQEYCQRLKAWLPEGPAPLGPDFSALDPRIMFSGTVAWLSGPPSTNEGASYTVQLDASDLGGATVDSWTVDWGDGTGTSGPYTGTDATHVYDDGPALHRVTASVTLSDTSVVPVAMLGDASFAANGRMDVAGAFSSMHFAAYGVQSDGKVILAGPTSDWTSIAVGRLNADGSVDNTFGPNGDGLATITLERTHDSIWTAYVRHVLVFPDNSLAIVSSIDTDSSGTKDYDFSVARLTATGQPDTTFGEDVGPGGIPDGIPDGEAYVNFSPYDYVTRAVLDSAGDIVMAGAAKSSGSSYFAVARLKGDTGQLDTTFSSTGKLADGPHVSVGVAGLAVDSSGNILISGMTKKDDPTTGRVMRFTSTGDPDNDFGVSGVLSTYDGNDEGLTMHGFGAGNMVVQGEETAGTYRILLSGEYDDDCVDDLGDPSPLQAVVRIYNAVDTSTGTFTELDDLSGLLGSSESLGRTSLLVDSADRIVVAGDISGARGFTARLVADMGTADGWTADPAFSIDGIHQFDGHTMYDYHTSLTETPDGGLLLSTENNGDWLTKYLPANNGFGDNGRLEDFTSGLTNFNFATHGIQSDGRIVIVGTQDDNDTIVARRLNVDGSQDDTFGNNGLSAITLEQKDRVTTTNLWPAHIKRVLVFPDDSLAVVSYVNRWNNDFCVTRLTADGREYPDFGLDGEAYVDFGGNEYVTLAVLDGTDIVLAGGGDDLHVARLDGTTGELDTDFGPSNDGQVTITAGSGLTVTGLSVASDHAIVLSETDGGQVVVMRLTASGGLDPAFDFYASAPPINDPSNDGTVPISNLTMSSFGGGNVVTRGTNEVLICGLTGQAADGKGGQAVIWSYDTSAGSFTTFASLGGLIGTTETLMKMGLTIDSLGRIVLAGHIDDSSTHERGFIARFTAAGLPDPTFGIDGGHQFPGSLRFNSAFTETPDGSELVSTMHGTHRLTQFVPSHTVTVKNVAPSATFAYNQNTCRIEFSGASDPSGADSVEFIYYFDLDPEDDEPFPYSNTTGSLFYIPALQGQEVRGRIEDKDGGYTDYTAYALLPFGDSVAPGPANLKADADAANNEIDLTWSYAGEEPGTQYQVYRSEDINDMPGQAIGGLRATADYSDNTAEHDTVYHYTVQIVGEDRWSNTAAAVLRTDANVTASWAALGSPAYDNGMVTMTWEISAAGVAEWYEIYRWEEGGVCPPTPHATIDDPATMTFTDIATDVEDGKIYVYKVRAARRKEMLGDTTEETVRTKPLSPEHVVAEYIDASIRVDENDSYITRQIQITCDAPTLSYVTYRIFGATGATLDDMTSASGMSSPTQGASTWTWVYDLPEELMPAGPASTWNWEISSVWDPDYDSADADTYADSAQATAAPVEEIDHVDVELIHDFETYVRLSWPRVDDADGYLVTRHYYANSVLTAAEHVVRNAAFEERWIYADLVRYEVSAFRDQDLAGDRLAGEPEAVTYSQINNATVDHFQEQHDSGIPQWFVDLDTYTDNMGEHAYKVCEDEVEIGGYSSGAYVPVNDGDVSPSSAEPGRNGTADFLDAPTVGPAAVEPMDENGDPIDPPNLVPLRFRPYRPCNWPYLSDLLTLGVTLDYHDSDPAEISASAGTLEDQNSDGTFNSTDDHCLRIWSLYDHDGDAVDTWHFLPADVDLIHTDYDITDPEQFDQAVQDLQRDYFILFEGELYIEGVRRSQSLGDEQIAITLDLDDTCNTDTLYTDAVQVTVVGPDLIMDTNDDNGYDDPRNDPDRVHQDQAELALGAIGKSLDVNDGDLDMDGVPDYADGIAHYDYATSLTCNDGSEDVYHHFTPMVLSLPAPIDLSVARMRLVYDDSDPADLSYEWGWPAPPADTYLRIWTAGDWDPGSTTPSERTAIPFYDVATQAPTFTGGSFVPSSDPHPDDDRYFYDPSDLAELGLTTSSREVMLYVEAVQSATDGLRIVVEVDPDGDGPAGFMAMDFVPVHVGYGDLDIDSDSNDANEPARDYVEDAIEGVAARPGKVIIVNDGDKDADGIPDLADGLGWRTGDGAGNLEEIFTEIVLEMSDIFTDPGSGLNLNTAWIGFEYGGSDPTDNALTDTNPVPADGYLRLWNLGETSSGTGTLSTRYAENYIKPFNPDSPSDATTHYTFNPDSTTLTPLWNVDTGNPGLATLYVEAVRASESLGDQVIRIHVDPDGDGPETWMVVDEVRATAVLATNSPFLSHAVAVNDGSANVQAMDVATGSKGAPWGHRRVFSTAFDQSLRGGMGNGWTSWPSLIHTGNGAIVLRGGESLYYEWEENSSAYVPRFDTKTSLSNTLAWTDSDGGSWSFDSNGRCVNYSDPGGNRTVFQYDSTYGQIETVTRNFLGQAEDKDILSYVYYNTGANAGLLRSVILKVGTKNVQTAIYAYHDGLNEFGCERDLKSVTIWPGGIADTRHIATPLQETAYCYSAMGQLEMVLRNDAIQRIRAAEGAEPFSGALTKAELQPYADLYLVYDATGRVAQQHIRGAGDDRSDSTDGNTAGALAYGYAEPQAGDAIGHGLWRTKTTETATGFGAAAVTKRYFTDSGGQLLLEVVQADGKEWRHYKEYDDRGLLTLSANADAVVSQNWDAITDYDLNVQLQPSAGMVTRNTYTNGLLTKTTIANGETSPEITQQELTYVAGAPIPAVETVKSGDGSTITYAYTWTENLPTEVTTTLPAIAVDDHAPETAVVVQEFDVWGRITRLVDAAENVFETEYGSTGLVTERTVTPYGGTAIVLKDATGDDLGTILQDQVAGLGSSHTMQESSAVGALVETMSSTGLVTVTQTDAATGTNVMQIKGATGDRAVLAEAKTFTDLGGRIYAKESYIAGEQAIRTEYKYDAGLRYWTRDAYGVISELAFDALGRLTARQIGNDTTTPAVVAEQVYDHGLAGPGNLTKVVAKPGNGAPDRVTYMEYDWRNRPVLEMNTDGLVTERVFDELGRIAEIKTYTGGKVTSDRIDITDPQFTLASRTVNSYDARGNVWQTKTFEVKSDGTIGGYQVDEFWYDGAGRVIKTVDPLEMATKYVYDWGGRVVQEAICSAVDDTTYEHAGDLTGDNVFSVTQRVYENDGRLKEVKQGTTEGNTVTTEQYEHYPNGLLKEARTRNSTAITGQDSDWFKTEYAYDNQERLVGIFKTQVDGEEVLKTAKEYDALGRETYTRLYKVTTSDGSSPSGEELLAMSQNVYQLGRLVQTREYAIDADWPTEYQATTYEYNDMGRQAKVVNADGSFHMTEYNDLGEVTYEYFAQAEGGNATTIDDDLVFAQTGYHYDEMGRVWMIESGNRLADSTTGLGRLDSSNALVSYQAAWYDAMGRQTTAANYGVAGTAPFASYAAYDGSSAPAAGSPDLLVNATTYDGYGRVSITTDNKGIDTKMLYDDANRLTHVVQNYVDFEFIGGLPIGTGNDTTPDPAEDVVKWLVRNNVGLVTNEVLLDVNGDGNISDSQFTSYVHTSGANTAVTPVPRKDLVHRIRHPEYAVGDYEILTYYADGSVATRSDVNDTVHTYTYDDYGRLVADDVTTFGSPDTDTVIQGIQYEYDLLGRLTKAWSTAAGDAVYSSVELTYDAWGMLESEAQYHRDGTTDDSTIRYTAETSDGDAKDYVRLKELAYPGGAVVGFDYSETPGWQTQIDTINFRLPGDVNREAANYAYMGSGQIAEVDHSAVTGGLLLEIGWDDLGRTDDQKWSVNGTAVDHYEYGYDANSNVLFKENMVNDEVSELYHANNATIGDAYDALDRLTDFTRGEFTVNRVSIDAANVSPFPRSTMSWDYDAATNATTVITDGTSESREYDPGNQLSQVGASTDVAHDPVGNMTKMPLTPADLSTEAYYDAVYDAWNRLVRVETTAGETVVEYRYDYQNRRTAKLIKDDTNSWTRTDYYYRETQVIEERCQSDLHDGQRHTPVSVDNAASTVYVYDQRFIHAPILRARDVDGDGDLDLAGNDELLFYAQDANFNTTALVDADGDIVEWYLYDPYGQVTIVREDGLGDLETTSWANSAQNEILYTGHHFDPETGLYYAINRYYHPRLGRFISKDPLGYVDGMNMYAYVGGNPASAMDPLGLRTKHGKPTDGFEAAADHRRMRFLGDRPAEFLAQTQPIVDVIDTTVTVIKEAATTTQDLAVYAWNNPVEAATRAGDIQDNLVLLTLQDPIQGMAAIMDMAGAYVNPDQREGAMARLGILERGEKPYRDIPPVEAWLESGKCGAQGVANVVNSVTDMPHRIVNGAWSSVTFYVKPTLQLLGYDEEAAYLDDDLVDWKSDWSKDLIVHEYGTHDLSRALGDFGTDVIAAVLAAKVVSSWRGSARKTGCFMADTLVTVSEPTAAGVVVARSRIIQPNQTGLVGPSEQARLGKRRQCLVIGVATAAALAVTIGQEIRRRQEQSRRGRADGDAFGGAPRI